MTSSYVSFQKVKFSFISLEIYNFKNIKCHIYLFYSKYNELKLLITVISLEQFLQCYMRLCNRLLRIDLVLNDPLHVLETFISLIYLVHKYDQIFSSTTGCFSLALY